MIFAMGEESGSAMKLLVVEDEADLRRTLTRALADEGFAVDVAVDGDEALHRALEIDYDAIVLDLMLPRRDGAAVLRALRQNGRTVPVLILTARDTLEDRVGNLNRGADDFLDQAVRNRGARRPGAGADSTGRGAPVARDAVRPHPG